MANLILTQQQTATLPKQNSLLDRHAICFVYPNGDVVIGKWPDEKTSKR